MTTHTRRRRTTTAGRARAAVALAALSTLAPPAFAVTRTWSGGAGAWEVGANWAPAGAPVDGDDVLIDADAADVTFSAPADPAALYTGLQIAAGSGTAAATLTLANGTLNTALTRVGLAGSGTFTHAGGTHTATSLILGPASARAALYALTAGTLNVTGPMTVGTVVGGSSTYAQTGGTANVGGGTNGLSLSANGGGAVVNLGGGTLNTTALTVGAFGVGTVNHSAGALAAGPVAINSGVYNLAAPGSVVATSLDVGVRSIGHFHHAGGSVVVSGALRLAVDATVPNATYNMSNGASLTVATTAIGVGGAASFNQNGGTHTVTGNGTNGLTLSGGSYNLRGGTLDTSDVRVALARSATFLHSGGTHTVSGTLTIAPAAGRTGTYTLEGSGVLHASAMVIGGGGATGNISTYFTQTAGSSTFGTVTILPGGQFLTGGTMRVTGGVVNSGTFRAIVPAGLTLGGGVRPTGTALAGFTEIPETRTLTASYVRQATLNISGTASRLDLRPRVEGGDTSVVRTLAFTLSGGSPRGTLDLADNALIVDYAAVSPFTNIARFVRTAYSPTAAAHWTGPGITSDVAATTPAGAVGYAEASAVLGLSGTQTATWQGQTVDATSVLVRYTLAGDTNLDGAVDFTDLVRLAQNYGSAEGASTWPTGDFTYDGNVDFADLVRLAQTYAAATPAAIPGATTDFHTHLAAAFASIPEPSVLAIGLTAATGFLLTRRRRGPRAQAFKGIPDVLRF